MYLLLKLIHIVAVILFLGNIITGLFWKFHADGSKDPGIIAHSFEGVIRSDRWFTIPGVWAILLSGFGAAIQGRLPILGTGWIFWSIVLFSISGLVFGLRVAPLQAQIVKFARAGAESGQFDWPHYRTMARTWELWGLMATLALFGAVALMVLKPGIPGL